MLLNPNRLQRKYPDARSGEIMAATVDFFESRGKARLKHDDHERVWYSDFLNFIAKERIFASLLTPAEYGAGDCRWDTYRISEFAEIVGFYGLSYWYPFQVTALGLGPIWMSDNEDAKRKAAAQLEQGEVFAFGLSEQTPRRRRLQDRHDPDAVGARLDRQWREVLHRQRQRGPDGLHVRQDRRSQTTSTSSSPPTPSTTATT